MKVNIESYREFKAIGIIWHGKMQNGPKELPQFWDKTFLPRSQEIKNTRIEEWGSANSYGIMWNFNMEKGEMDYLAGIEVVSDVKIPDGMTVWEIPAQTYAVTRGPLSIIGELIKTIYDWLPTSGYKRVDGAPEFELYGEDFHKENGQSAIGYYVPIEEVK